MKDRAGNIYIPEIHWVYGAHYLNVRDALLEMEIAIEDDQKLEAKFREEVQNFLDGLIAHRVRKSENDWVGAELFYNSMKKVSSRKSEASKLLSYRGMIVRFIRQGKYIDGGKKLTAERALDVCTCDLGLFSARLHELSRYENVSGFLILAIVSEERFALDLYMALKYLMVKGIYKETADNKEYIEAIRENRPVLYPLMAREAIVTDFNIADSERVYQKFAKNYIYDDEEFYIDWDSHKKYKFSIHDIED